MAGGALKAGLRQAVAGQAWARQVGVHQGGVGFTQTLAMGDSGRGGGGSGLGERWQAALGAEGAGARGGRANVGHVQLGARQQRSRVP